MWYIVSATPESENRGLGLRENDHQGAAGGKPPVSGEIEQLVNWITPRPGDTFFHAGRHRSRDRVGGD